MIRRAVVLAMVVGLVWATRLLPPGPRAHDLAAGMALGLLLLGGYLTGWILGRLRLPRITGYIVFGLAAGPQLSHLLEAPLIEALEPVDGVAVALIALNAGAELKFGWLRKHLGRIAVICGLTAVLVGGGIFALTLAAADLVPLLAALDGPRRVAAAAILGVTMASTSPLVVLAVTSETRARGPVTDTLLGVAILMDLVVVLAAGVVLGVARAQVGAGGAHGADAVALELTVHILGSIVLGLLLGGALVGYVRVVGRELSLVVAGLCLGISSVGETLALEPLLLAIAVGVVLINFGGSRSEDFVHAVERVSLPVYALFFGLVGANLDLRLLASLGVVGLVLALARALTLWAATTAGARLTRSEDAVRRYAWLGFVSQAGITLGIAVTVARTFPDWGPALEDLIVGVVALNTLVGPVLHRHAVVKANEVGADAAPAAPRKAAAAG